MNDSTVMLFDKSIFSPLERANVLAEKSLEIKSIIKKICDDNDIFQAMLLGQLLKELLPKIDEILSGTMKIDEDIIFQLSKILELITISSFNNLLETYTTKEKTNANSKQND